MTDVSYDSTPCFDRTQGYRCERCGLDVHRECQMQVRSFS